MIFLVCFELFFEVFDPVLGFGDVIARVHGLRIVTRSGDI